MNQAVFYWAELNKLLITYSINDNGFYSSLNLIAHKLDPSSKKAPRQMDCGVSITFQSFNIFDDEEMESLIVFSHDDLEELYYIGVF